MVAGALGLLYGWHLRGTIRANGIDPSPNCTGIDQFFYGVLALETASPLKASMIRSPCVRPHRIQAFINRPARFSNIVVVHCTVKASQLPYLIANLVGGMKNADRQ